jgi:phosphopantetheinyl transferase (holo-ACP synthase)
VTTSSTSSSDIPPERPVRCGVDVEETRRFRRFLPSAAPAGADGDDSLLFHPAEIRAALAGPDPARWLCACFCAKEALFKALGEPFNFNELEFLPADPPDWRLHGSLAADGLPGRGKGECRISLRQSPEECMVTVVFFNKTFHV